MSDLINSLFEISGGFFVLLSIIKVIKDKKVAGVSYGTIGFFATWGYWNLFYYPSLNQWLSTAGAGILAATNTIYVLLLIYYARKDNERM